jgi:glucose-6-phosphate 1-dehydrogenase
MEEFTKLSRGNAAKEQELLTMRSELEKLRTLSSGMSKLVLSSNTAAPHAGVPHLDHTIPLTVVIFGATGDLAKKKLFPALYQLILLGHLPRSVNIVGVGRRAVQMEAFLAKQCAKVNEDARLPLRSYTGRISFHAGGYDDPDAFAQLATKLDSLEQGRPGNRLFFLSIPPTVFGTVSQMIASKVRAAPGGFTHLVIEKPFGRDTQTFNELDACTASLFDESQLFRIDHYLGKEVIQNIMHLRFSNSMFEPLWSNQHIESVEITFKENLGTGGRGGYFDGFGIIRDIMQNHLLQVFTYVAMDAPADSTNAAVAHAKVELLRAVKTLEFGARHTFLGQFTGNGVEPGYLEDKTVPEGSRCPTFAAVVLEVQVSAMR